MNTKKTPVLGLKENLAQFFILVIVNAIVGALIGLERSILPAIAENEFNIIAKSAILSFIIIFGFTKAFTNYFAGRFSEKYGRKIVLVIGWLFSIPFPFILMWASSWSWILFANILLGISQGLTWSTTVIMKIDLVGSSKRGLAMGFNEFAGYFAVAISALITGYIAEEYSLRPQPFYLGILYVILGLFISIFIVKETKEYAEYEAKNNQKIEYLEITQKELFIKTSFKDKNLSSVTQAGFVNNLNDGMAWGLFPLFFANQGLDIKTIGTLSAIYPMTWGISQLWTGHLSDKIGRKWLIVWGMWIQVIGIITTVISISFIGFAIGGLLLGIGTAMVYPTLLASIGDVAHPSWRASSVGIYRLWRDSGYAIGAIISGITSDFFGLNVAIWLVAFITFLSGGLVAIRMKETLGKNFNYLYEKL
ncbi:MAG: MFS transporter [Candidatus Sericytochromatia bacterium]